MGFKLPGIKVKNYGTKASSSPVKQVVDERSGKRFSEIDYDLISRDPLGRTKQFTSSVIGQKAENPDPFGLTFQNLNLFNYDTNLDFPYMKSRARLLGAGDALTEEEYKKHEKYIKNRGFRVEPKTEIEGQPTQQYYTRYRLETDSNTGETIRVPYQEKGEITYGPGKRFYTPEQLERNRFDLTYVLTPSADGYADEEKQARRSSKLSNTLDEAYGSLVREEITPDEFEETVNVVRDDFTNSGVFKQDTLPTILTNEQINVYEDVIEQGKAKVRLKQEEALENSRNWFLPPA